jgi:membrane associated rhomboid family serine protease
MIAIALLRKNGLSMDSWIYIPTEPFLDHGARLLKAGFAHADWFHFFFNMVYLWEFGNDIEQAIGFNKTLILFLVGVVGTHLLYTLAGGTVPTLGASGAIFSFMTFYALSFPHRRIRSVFARPFSDYLAGAETHVMLVPVWIYYGIFILNEVIALTNRHGDINHTGHLAGALIGALFFLAVNSERKQKSVPH